MSEVDVFLRATQHLGLLDQELALRRTADAYHRRASLLSLVSASASATVALGPWGSWKWAAWLVLVAAQLILPTRYVRKAAQAEDAADTIRAMRELDC